MESMGGGGSSRTKERGPGDLRGHLRLTSTIQTGELPLSTKRQVSRANPILTNSRLHVRPASRPPRHVDLRLAFPTPVLKPPAQHITRTADPRPRIEFITERRAAEENRSILGKNKGAPRR